MATEFVNKCWILAEMWTNYRGEPEFAEYFDWADVGVPLAWAVSQNLVVLREDAVKFIEDAWALLITALEIEDRGFTDLQDFESSLEEPLHKAIRDTYADDWHLVDINKNLPPEERITSLY